MAQTFTRRTVSALMASSVLAGAAPYARAQATSRQVTLDLTKATTPVDRFFDLSVGADYPGVTIRDANLAQLKTAAHELGFRYLRFHDIFHDELGTVKLVDKKVVYDWTKIDYLYDTMLKYGIKPFIELGFTPSAMKTSDQTLFYWKGNTSHPRPDMWKALINEFVRHLISRYGIDEVRTWYFEVWNEPNLDGFWQYADQEAYFALYGLTARTIKAIDPALRVGGPSTAGAAWVPELLAFAKATNTPVDFVTTHTYGVDYGYLDEEGKMDLQLSKRPDAVIGDVKKVRAEIEASHLPGLPLIFTEWSTSYNPRDLSHDSYVAAAYILSKLKSVQGTAQGMSYWVYSDLFEEPGPPSAAFHGGFGLMTREGIRKASWFTYKYLNALKGFEIPSADAQVWAATENGTVNAVVWDFQLPDQQGKSNGTFFSKLVPNAPAPDVTLNLTGLKPGRYALKIHRTGYKKNDAYSAYIELGAPKDLTPAQIKQMHSLTKDAPETQKTIRIGADGKGVVSLPMHSNDVVLVSLTPQ
ncbi:cellulase family glycosylhydrolase [Asticcacaulis sp. ZE23SCel15]|uniref:GH39 family glycosyl hydrolase n=1 Tax=Asticcacaulis sp. ZE23SCel15 TaxID=3059027 RepID=UPI00265F264B|nr:cellulase family glycosylhydrolase [Asticcacaulis sp. ZE23SCel15]WKL58735.1 cellulase family glycosylhydrolase [Asticcacaulis sp. ZE23SCel15]